MVELELGPGVASGYGKAVECFAFFLYKLVIPSRLSLQSRVVVNTEEAWSFTITPPSLSSPALPTFDSHLPHNSAMNSIRGGMQVHAVPESERAVDASGKRLPWGYEFAEYVGLPPSLSPIQTNSQQRRDRP